MYSLIRFLLSVSLILIAISACSVSNAEVESRVKVDSINGLRISNCAQYATKSKNSNNTARSVNVFGLRKP